MDGKFLDDVNFEEVLAKHDQKNKEINWKSTGSKEEQDVSFDSQSDDNELPFAFVDNLKLTDQEALSINGERIE